MGKMNMPDELIRRLDNYEDADVLDSYTPNKSKKVIKEDLFNGDEYDEKSTNFNKKHEEIRAEERRKLVKIVIITMIILLSAATLTWVVYKYTTQLANNIERQKINDILSTKGVLTHIRDLPVDKIKSTLTDIDADGDGLYNKVENTLGSNVGCKDTDSDGIDDRTEMNTKGLNIVGYSVEQRVADLETMGYSRDYPVTTKVLDINYIAKALNIPSENVLLAYKVYNPTGNITFKNVSGVQSVMVYEHKTDSLQPIKFKKVNNDIDITLENDSLVICFNITEKELFDRINYKKYEVVKNTYKYKENNAVGLLKYMNSYNYSSIYKDRNFKTKFDIDNDTLHIPTIWDKSNDSNSIGQAWFTGAIYNRAQINEYSDVADKYSEYRWLKPLNYYYNISEYNSNKLGNIQFNSKQLKEAIDSNDRIQVEVDKLTRPDKEYASVITQLTRIAIDNTIEDIINKNYSSGKSVLTEVLKMLGQGQTVLALMANESDMHAVLVYGVYQSEIDEDIYNFSVYDSNINYGGNAAIQILKAKVKHYANPIKGEDDYVTYKYGLGGDYMWDNEFAGDIFLFYKLKTDLTLELIQ